MILHTQLECALSSWFPHGWEEINPFLEFPLWLHFLIPWLDPHLQASECRLAEGGGQPRSLSAPFLGHRAGAHFPCSVPGSPEPRAPTLGLVLPFGVTFSQWLGHRSPTGGQSLMGVGVVARVQPGAEPSCLSSLRSPRPQCQSVGPSCPSHGRIPAPSPSPWRPLPVTGRLRAPPPDREPLVLLAPPPSAEQASPRRGSPVSPVSWPGVGLGARAVGPAKYGRLRCYSGHRPTHQRPSVPLPHSRQDPPLRNLNIVFHAL